MSFRFLFWAAVLTLVFSASAGWIFYGDHEPDPDVQRRTIQQNLIEKARAAAETGGFREWTAYGRALIDADADFQDPGAALKWLRKAADKGYPPAQLTLGDMYAKGLGVGQDYYRAAEWYGLAARLSKMPEAHFKMGDAYFRGLGVAQDYGAAVTYFETAAGAGHPVAQYILGSMYEAGWGAEKDLIEAWVWYRRAEPGAGAISAYEQTYDVAQALARVEGRMNKSQMTAAKRRLKN